ncbi:3828_t:CDS:1, partial [Ambispora leptoticha]
MKRSSINNRVKEITSKPTNNDTINSPTSTIKSKFSLPVRKSGPNISRPKSDTSISRQNDHVTFEPQLISNERTIEDKSTLHPYRSNTTPPYLGRSPSTPTLRNSNSSSNTDLPSIEDELFSSSSPPQLPPLLPTITFSSDLICESSPPSSRASSPIVSSSPITTPSVSPSNSSISSSDTTNDDETEAPLDITTFLAAPRLTQRVRLKSGR